MFDADFLAGGAHPKVLGPVEEIPYLKSQQRLMFARCGVDRSAFARRLSPRTAACGASPRDRAGAEGDVEEVDGFGPARPRRRGISHRESNGAPSPGAEADQKYIVCNADEGDSGTFADRMLMEGDPFLLIEGMTIAGLAVGATQGYVYIRSEYPHAFAHVSGGARAARAGGLLGAERARLAADAFDLEARLGAGAYICGEETSLLESLEGKRGQVRAKPPLPAIQGLFGKPTVINNVLSFASDAVDPGTRRRGLRRLRHRPLARHAAVPACRQCQARRPGRDSLRRDDP